MSAKGVKPDPKKIQAMTEWVISKNLKQLRDFIGLTGYYIRFIQGYAFIATLLTNLLNKDAFIWNSMAQTSFEELKLKMTQAHVLAMPNFSLSFELETNASKYAIGGVLMQQGHSIAIFSKKMSPQMYATFTYVRELFATTETVAKIWIVHSN